MKIPIVNEQDEIIKYINRSEKQPWEISRATGLWVTNEKGDVLLVQRSFDKKIDPGKWGPAVSGTVEEGETYEQNIIKEAEEEIGLTSMTLKTEHKIRRSTNHEYFAQWFSTIVDSNYNFVKQDSEVEQIKWLSREELIKSFKEKPDNFLPSFGSAIEYFLK